MCMFVCVCVCLHQIGKLIYAGVECLVSPDQALGKRSGEHGGKPFGRGHAFLLHLRELRSHTPGHAGHQEEPEGSEQDAVEPGAV